MSRSSDRRWLPLTVVSVLAMLLFLDQPASACSVCFGDPEQSGPVQAAILLLLGLVVVVQVALARLFWRLLRSSRS